MIILIALVSRSKGGQPVESFVLQHLSSLLHPFCHLCCLLLVLVITVVTYTHTISYPFPSYSNLNV